MYIFYDGGDDNFELYWLNLSKKSCKLLDNDILNKLVPRKAFKKDKYLVFLLSEDKFIFKVKRINIVSNTNIKNIDKLLYDSLSQNILKENLDEKGYTYLYYFINNVSNKNQTYYIDCVNVYINNLTYLELRQYVDKFLDIDDIVYIYPQSIFTISKLSSLLREQSRFSIIYIYENVVKLINISNWFVEDVYYLNFWKKYIKQLFYQSDMYKLYLKLLKSADNITEIEFQIINRFFGNYFSLLYSWLQDHKVAKLLYISDDLIYRFVKDRFISKWIFILTLKSLEKINNTCNNIDISEFAKAFPNIKFNFINI